MCAGAHSAAPRSTIQGPLGRWPIRISQEDHEEEMKMVSLRALALPLVAASLALAAPALAGGTDEQRDACSNDAFKLCSSDIPDEGAIESCLRRNQSRLSPACKMVMQQSAPAEATPRMARRGHGGSRAAAAQQQQGAGSGPDAMAGLMGLLSGGDSLFDDD
jgi:hypothetical protein